MTSRAGEDNDNSSVQVHLRLRRIDVHLLRLLAAERDQTLSATVRFLIYQFQKERSKSQ
jgi:hypothetical protein